MSVLVLASMATMAFAQEKIVNGTEATPEEYPETVYISIRGSTGGGSCTGSLIHSNWVLTAAHCFDSTVVEETGASAGTTVSFGPGGTPGFTRTIAAERVAVHEHYRSLEESLVAERRIEPGEASINDLALIKLAEPVDGTPMALNSEPLDPSWVGRDITHIGFGITAFEGSGGGTKRYTNVPIIGYTDGDEDGNWSVSFFDTEQGRSTCQGDSGGPGVYIQGNGYIQIGITSYGQGCGSGTGTKMRVDAYLDWILGPKQDIAGDDLDGVPEVLTEAARPATFNCSHQLDPGSPNSFAIGTAPLDLKCTVSSGDLEAIDSVTWTWGDGSEDTYTGNDIETAHHVYTEMNVYNVRACMSGMRGPNNDIAFEDCAFKTNYVNVCDVPVAEFEVEPGTEDLTLNVRNRTSLSAVECVSNASWEVYEGTDVSGTPLYTFNSWEPKIKVEQAGTYTLQLNVGGLGGTGGAKATVQVKSPGLGCSTAPSSVGLFMLPLLALLHRRS